MCYIDFYCVGSVLRLQAEARVLHVAHGEALRYPSFLLCLRALPLREGGAYRVRLYGELG